MSTRWTAGGWRRGVALAALGLAVLVGIYAALAVWKAIDYTTTPRRPLPAVTPAAAGLVYEEVTFPSGGADPLTLSGWWVPREGSRRAVILVHGRYEDRASHLALARPLWERGFNVLLFDLRGHGASPPASCSYGLRERWDVAGAARYTHERGMAAAGIGVLGWSLGAVSALLAMPDAPQIAAVVSDSAYADDEPLLARNPLRPGLRLALRLARDVDLGQVRPGRALARAGGRPVFLIHGAHDTAVPVAHVERLRRAGGDAVAEVWVVPDAGHTQAFTSAPDEYLRRVAGFFDDALSAS